ncbi:MAG: hypothetical protein PHE06_15615 [Lachnospiraceae bacterium]|nr:hypothetical protein [Lachnospiraceae bacterium]MDD3797359.1 hypothetical protein [Lachnospiraceae bacterium]
MNWNEKCMLDLTHHNLFEDNAHRIRFRDLLNCYYGAAFFTKGLCKCMYLSCWDEEHFAIMLEILNEMTLDGDKNLNMMKDQGEIMVQSSVGFENVVLRLSNAFLNDTFFEMPDLGVMNPEGAHMIRQAVKAAEYIEELPEVHEE